MPSNLTPRQQFVQEVLTRLTATYIEGHEGKHETAAKALESLVPSWKKLAERAAELIFGE